MGVLLALVIVGVPVLVGIAAIRIFDEIDRTH